MAREEYRLGAIERVVLALAGFLLALVGATLRVRIEGEDRLRALLDSGHRVILASWHARLLAGIVHFGRYRPAIMISQSRDGARIAWVARRLGFRPVRGSSSHGGVRGLLTLTREVAAGSVGVHLVDGPRGPAGEVKAGVIPLAARSGAVIVPVYVAARWRLEARSWDRMQIPLPFSRVDGWIADPLGVPPRPSRGEAEALRADLEKRMREAYGQLDGRSRPEERDSPATPGVHRPRV